MPIILHPQKRVLFKDLVYFKLYSKLIDQDPK